MSNKNNPSKSKVDLAKKIAKQNKNTNGVYNDFEEMLLKAFRFITSLIDRIFSSQKHLGLFSLVMAVLLYLIVNVTTDQITGTLSSAKTLNNVKVNVTYSTETFEVTGVPTSCSVTITGEAANVNAAASKSGACVLNLEGLTEGTHYVNVNASGYGDAVTVTANPSQALVTLSKKTTKAFDLSYDYINQEKLGSKYILGVPEFTNGNNEIYIRASEETLNSIALVKALIDVSGQTSDFTTEAPLVAYNSKGQLVDAEISPSSVTVTVKVSSPHKSVPITLKLSGETTLGFSVESIKIDHQLTEIYAPESVLANISEVYVNLDLSTLLGDSDLVLPIELPSGVNSAEFTSVSASVVLTATVERTFENLPINYENNNNNLVAESVDPMSVNVVARGTQTNIDALTTSDFKVYFDMNGLTAGEYDLPLYIKWTNSNTYIDMDIEPIVIHIVLVNKE